MELSTFFQALITRWRLIVVIWVATVAVSIVYSFELPTLYRSKGTFIIRPKASMDLGEDLVNAIEILSRRAEINSTFAEIASSRKVKENVIEILDLSSWETRYLEIEGNTVEGANVLEISIVARTPDLAVVVADEVARETLSAAGEVYDVFELELLDNFEQPNKPIDSNNRLIILMGVMFGLIAGIATVFAIEFINIQLLGNQTSQFIDRRTGKYTRAYFDHRLTQEIIDSNRSKYFYSLALIRLLGQEDDDVDHLEIRSNQDFDNIYKLLRSSFRDHDVIAQYDPNTIGLIIPDLIGVEIKERLKLIISKSNSGSENGNGGFSQNGIAIGIVSVEDHTKDEDELIRLLSQAVFLASEKENDGIFLRTVKQRNQAEFVGEKEEV